MREHGTIVKKSETWEEEKIRDRKNKRKKREKRKKEREKKERKEEKKLEEALKRAVRSPRQNQITFLRHSHKPL